MRWPKLSFCVRRPGRATNSLRQRRSFLAATLGLTMAATAACSLPKNEGPDKEIPWPGKQVEVTELPTEAKLYRPEMTQVTEWIRKNKKPRWLDPITNEPVGIWVNGPEDVASAGRNSAAASGTKTLMTLVMYSVPRRGCSDTEGAKTADEYQELVSKVIGVLSSPTMVVLEPDAVAAQCFNPERAEILKTATEAFSKAGHYVFIDAGHPNWLPANGIAGRLRQAGIGSATGFALNVSNRHSVEASRHYGDLVSGMVGGRPYVVDTSRAGGKLSKDESGNEIWCNPPDQALGPRPSFQKVGKNVALLWVKTPGESDGNWEGCGPEIAPPGVFSPLQARKLILGASWVSAEDKAKLPSEAELR